MKKVTSCCLFLFLLMRTSSWKILTSFDLKIMALVSMIIDHLGYMFFPEIVGFRIIGRMAFILYAFLLVEGCHYTSNRSNYIHKLAIWAILSELPYDLAIHHEIFYFNAQNIFFTLLIGVVGIHFFQKHYPVLLKLFIAGTGIFVGYWIKTDYSWYGVMTIYGFYFLKNFPPLKFAFIQSISTIASFTVIATQVFAFLGFVPIWMYNGKLGYKIGNVYYAFYAGHLLLLLTIQYFHEI